jgi:hypothetical protein
VKNSALFNNRLQLYNLQIIHGVRGCISSSKEWIELKLTRARNKSTIKIGFAFSVGCILNRSLFVTVTANEIMLHLEVQTVVEQGCVLNFEQ